MLEVTGVHTMKVFRLSEVFLLLASNLKHFQVKMNVDVLSTREMWVIFVLLLFCFVCPIRFLKDISHYSSDVSNTSMERFNKHCTIIYI